MANEVYLPAIAESLTGRQRHPVDEIVVGGLGRWFLRNFIEPSAVTRRAKAPRKIAPPVEIELSTIDLFLRSNEEARDVVSKASEYDVNRVRFRNPFVAVIRFTVGTGLEIISKHQDRHLLQAERVRLSVGFPVGR